ncbi:DUF6153 family protein [Catellatospora chokoriensis]|uniref:DUF6153 family protein n=1 Tax=Catellatospora chokoriensis TaxID=310353 RepID=UPI0017857805|nr:DUF6153 family protein [Catellatospora chokoriensis]
MTDVHRVTLRALLLAVLFGLTLMHTFGHAAHAGPHHPESASANTQAVPAAAPAFQQDDCHGCGDHQPWQAFSVCMAVLSALALLAIAWFWLRRAAGRVHPPRPAAAAFACSRGPPAVEPLRIRLARLSVSRT